MQQRSTEKDEGTYKSACRMCHGGCGVLVHVKDGAVVKIEGDPESPLNKGKLCVKGLSSIEHLYNPDRLKYPLKRTGRRGEGKWERISWTEALNTIAARIKEIKRDYGAESIAIGTGTGRHHFHHVPRFANAIGTPNWCEPGTAQCFLPRIKVGLMTYGDLPVCDYYGDISPKCLLVWGHNPLISGPDGEIQFKVRECLRKGPKLLVVDPRRTELAEKADVWLQLRPGTDDALALSMLHVIINEDLCDNDFVEKWTVGFDKLATRVKDCTPEWAEEITWVPAAKIKEAARLFAIVKPGCIEWGCAIEHTPNSIQTARAVSMLPALTGNIDVPGGWIFGMHVLGFFPFLAENLSEEMKQCRLGADTYKVLSGVDTVLPSAHIPTLFTAMRTGEPYPIKAFLIFGNNALVTYGNVKEVYESLMKLDFLAVMDIYMTPTAELADIVLPAATWLEVDEIVGLPYVAENIVLAQQKIVSVEEARQDEEIFVELARKMNLPVGTEPAEEIYDEQLGTVLGTTFEELKRKGFASIPQRYHKYKDFGFFTPSQKIELYSSTMERLGYDPLPYYEEPPESPVSTPEIANEYPLILITGARVGSYFNSEYRQVPALRKKHPDPLMEIHPETAHELGIAEDDWAWIETRRGKIKQKAKLTRGIDPRVVHVEHGWWFPEEPGPEHGVWKSNANVLTDTGPPYDPAMGTYQLRALLCKVYRVA